MIENLRFYLKHSLNDLRTNGQRTFFALLCIAAGVAAIVSLQTLAVMIADTLTGSLQESNHADIRISVGLEKEDILRKGIDEKVLVVDTSTGFGGSLTGLQISEGGMKILAEWAESTFPGQLDEQTYRRRVAGGTGVTIGVPAKNIQVSFVTPYLFESDKYPLYGRIRTVDGKTINEVIKSDTDLILSRALARKIDAQIGDVVNISGSQADFVVRGIVPDEAEGGMTNLGEAFFGYFYLDVSAAPLFGRSDVTVQMLYWKLKDPSRVAEIDKALQERFPYLQTLSTEALREQNQIAATALNQLVTTMGLISLLIGGIGIINTMQVVVRRRTLEVAVLKTIGMQANQVTVLFLVEAFLMGLIGSLGGIVLGWFMTFLIKGVAETFLGQALAFRITPGPALAGIFIGTLVTTVFGFLPTLTAGQVRPGVVLRPNEAIVPRVGLWRSLAALLVVVLALTVITQTILGNFLIAFGVIVGAFIAAGILYLQLWLLIWVVGRFFPSFGVVDLKIALRSMLAMRRRAAITLLALAIGVFSLSLITLFTTTILNLFESLLVDQSGGNVLLFAAGNGVFEKVESKLKTADGVKNYTLSGSYSVQLLSVETAAGQKLTPEDLDKRLKQSLPDMGNPNNPMAQSPIRMMLSSIAARKLDSKSTLSAPAKGRDLTPADAGKPVMILSGNSFITSSGLDVGDKLTFEINSGGFFLDVLNRNKPRITFEVVGIASGGNVSLSPDAGQSYAPFDAFPAGMSPTQVFAGVSIEDAKIGAFQRSMAEIPGSFVLETQFINNLLQLLVNQITSFPILVAALSLLVGGIVIANSVALTTMERRREIAIMKSVGLQRERVLGMLLLENGIMGLIGGLIGVGIGLIGLMIMQGSLQSQTSGVTLGNIVPYGTALALMGLCVLVALVAAMLTAWNASGEKPLNVLRYE